MRTTLAATFGVIALLAAGCALVTPERAELDRVILRVIEPCERQYPKVRVLGFDEHGRLQMLSPENAGDLAGFQHCAQDALKREFDLKQPGKGQVVATTGPASVAIQAVGTAMLVPARVNDARATLLLDTGASFTIVRPAFAQRAGIEVLPDAPKYPVMVGGGQIHWIPIVRVRSLMVGDAAVEDIHVGVFELLRGVPNLDGVLGGNFLNHFKVTIEHSRGRLTLDPSRASVAIAPAPAVPRVEAPAMPSAPASSERQWRQPVWTPGDEWRLRWQSPTGSGTYVLTVEGEETVDDVAHYVVRSGSRQTYYVKATLGLHLGKVNGAVTYRHTPAIVHDWPLRVGKSWEQNYRREDGAGRVLEIYSRCTVAEETTLSVPAGTFLTLRVVCRSRAERIVYEAWYAEEVKNWVRWRIVSTRGDRIDELVSYSPTSEKAPGR